MNNSVRALLVAAFVAPFAYASFAQQNYPTSPAPAATTTSPAFGSIAPVVSASAENSHIIKAAPGTLFSAYATNLTATAGFMVVLNTASVPADGAITPLECVPLPANSFASINYNPGPASPYTVGITIVLTSSNTCFTKTTGTITGFIKGAAL